MGPISSLVEFVDAILSVSPPANRLTTYRGHGNIDFKLQPSIFRRAVVQENEHILLRELIVAHPEDFTVDTTALETLVRMQHYTLPTRLLDVSVNPLVALYFACESVKKRIPIIKGGRRTTKTVETDGEVITLSVFKRRVRYFDSDTVSCLANLSRLSWILKNKIDTSLDMEDFNKTLSIKRLLHFIRQEKNGFEAEIEPDQLDGIFLVKTKQNNKRILAQAGAFYVFGLKKEIVDSSDGIKISRLTVDAGSKVKILNQLDLLGINEKTMFPEIERAARYITGSLSIGHVASKILK